MVIAIASGKGGTGKTAVATALALSAGQPVTLLDCDVEGANDALFFNTGICLTHEVTVPVPSIDPAKCVGCGSCHSICAFNAIVVIGKTARVYKELCHSCGGCRRVCAYGAISETASPIGQITKRHSGNVTLLSGELTVGKAMSPPVIREVKKYPRDKGITIIDSPPGTSCPMINAVRKSDFVLLVTEPTPFGLHDLVLAVRAIRMLRIQFGVIINRCDSGDDRVENFCSTEQIEVVMRIQEKREIAESISRGRTILDAGSEYRPLFAALLKKMIARFGMEE